MREKIIALLWADNIYRRVNNIEACDAVWLSQALFILTGGE